MRALVAVCLFASFALSGCAGTPDAATSPTPTPSMAPQAKEMYVVATDFSTPASEGFYKFRPQTFSFKQGETINVTIKNAVGNRDVHNLVLEGHGIRLVGVKDLTASATVNATKPGSFKYYCDLVFAPGATHRQAGFEGTLTIT